MSSRFYQLQSEAAKDSRSSRSHSPHSKSARLHGDSRSSSESSSNSSSSSSSSAGSYYGSETVRYSMDSQQPRVEVLRCSRCAMCVETISSPRSGDSRRVSTDDASASGMVRFGHNLYYCDRCAKMVGYK